MNHLQPLEQRTLLASIAPDLGFGSLGEADVGAELFVAAQPGGKILTVGESGATRLNADGSMDNTFIDHVAFFLTNLTSVRAGLSGSRLIVAGRAANSNIVVRAFSLGTGSVDTTFGVLGTATLTPAPPVPGQGTGSIGIGSISATPDGGVIISTTHHLGSNGFANVFYKLDSDGQLDSDFGDAGVFVLDPDLVESSTSNHRATIAVATDGKLLIHRFRLLTRFSANAEIDTSFGDQGNFDDDDLHIGGFKWFSTMLPLDDGRLLLSVDDATDFETLGRIVRLTADGEIDTTFGDGNEAGPGDVKGASFITDIAIDSTGRIVALTGAAAIVRFTPDGDLDLTFDDDGVACLSREIELGFRTGRLSLDASDRPLVGEPERITRYIERDRVVLRDDGVLRIDGSEEDDTLEATISGNNVNLLFNGDPFSFPAADVNSLSVFLGLGENDVSLLVDLDATIVTSRNLDSIVTGNGSNHIETGEGGATVISGDGDDTIIADSFARVTSNGGNDDIRVLGSQESPTQQVTVNAGDGDDMIRFEQHAWFHQWVVDAGSGNDTVESGNANSTLTGGDGDDTLYGWGRLLGSAGNDSLSGRGNFDGGDGDDVIQGEDSPDRMFGGAGNDTIRGGEGNDFLHGEVGDDVVEAGEGNDSIRGGDGNDQLRGDDGDDLMHGQEGHDSMYGGSGNDQLLASVGNDLLDGGLGNDTLLGEAGIDKLLGNGGNDRLYGGDDLDRLYGQDGNDLIFGGNGDDLLNGGAGADILRGEAGNDQLYAEDNVRDSLFGHDGRDTAFADRDDILRTIESRR